MARPARVVVPAIPDHMTHRGDRVIEEREHVGCVRALTDDAGAVVERYDYEDYGRSYALDASGTPLPGGGTAGRSAIGNRYRFTGREFDEATGLYGYRTRYYDPRAGRFTSRDTIGLWGDPANLGNAHTYVMDNAWTLSDPYGLFGFADIPTIPDAAVNYSAGLGDALLLGFGDDLRSVLGGASAVNPCTTSYQLGAITSLAAGFARIGYAASAKLISIIAPTAAAASKGRNTLKVIFRGGLGRNWRPPNLTKYRDEMELRAAAGRTHRRLNTYGGLVVLSSLAGVSIDCPDPAPPQRTCKKNCGDGSDNSGPIDLEHLDPWFGYHKHKSSSEY